MATNESPVIDKTPLIAVLPFYNLSGTKAPLQDIRRSLINSLKDAGLNILDDNVLEEFITRHRIRYTGGIDSVNAEALGKETRAETVLITSLELYSEMAPPKIAFTSRLVSVGSNLSILWMKGIGLAGDDSPGMLGLGLIENFQILLEKAIKQLSASLSGYLASQKGKIDSSSGKFGPKVSYRSPVIAPELKYRIAVLPFINFSERKKAGEIISLNFVRQFAAYENFDSIEPGEIRQSLLRFRIIMDDGLSLPDADLLFRNLDADLILTGKIMDYQDYQGIAGKTKVDFSTLLIERKSREVVWSSKSYNEGDDGVYFFDLGRVNTAQVMASEMAHQVVEMIVEKTH
ncbi:MAG: hypothetical protein MUO88_11880 [Desulfobacterales bacterium]|nr:hypothetical protein [Desulfobacterales bacterium]